MPASTPRSPTRGRGVSTSAGAGPGAPTARGGGSASTSRVPLELSPVERRLALGDREPALVERPADDHAGERRRRRGGELAQVVEGADPARVDQLRPGLGRGLGAGRELVQPRTLERPVDLDRGEDETAAPRGGRGRRSRRRPRRRWRAPSPRPRPAPARASAATTIRSPCSAASASTRAGSESAAVPRIARAAPAASTAATSPASRRPPPTWTGTLDRVADPLDVLDVDRGARAGPVEVDDVQRPRALLDPAPSGVERIGVEGGLALVVALDQPDGAPAADVDRGIEDQAASRNRGADRRRSWPAGRGRRRSTSPGGTGPRRPAGARSRRRSARRATAVPSTSASRLRPRGEAVDEVERGPVGDPARQLGLRCPGDRLPADVRDLQARRPRVRRRGPRSARAPPRRRARSRTRTGAGTRGRCRAPASRPRPARRSAGRARARRSAPSPRRRRRRPAGPAPSAARASSWSSVITASAPTRSNAFSTERRFPIP